VTELRDDVDQKRQLLEELEKLAGVYHRLHQQIEKRKSGAAGPLPGLPGGPPLSDKEGILQLQSSGRWAVYRPGRVPVEITSGDLFRVDSGDGYHLANGHRAAIGEQ
jgi:hypothetical protein